MSAKYLMLSVTVDCSLFVYTSSFVTELLYSSEKNNFVCIGENNINTYSLKIDTNSI